MGRCVCCVISLVRTYSACACSSLSCISAATVHSAFRCKESDIDEDVEPRQVIYYGLMVIWQHIYCCECSNDKITRRPTGQWNICGNKHVRSFAHWFVVLIYILQPNTNIVFECTLSRVDASPQFGWNRRNKLNLIHRIDWRGGIPVHDPMQIVNVKNEIAFGYDEYRISNTVECINYIYLSPHSRCQSNGIDSNRGIFSHTDLRRRRIHFELIKCLEYFAH